MSMMEGVNFFLGSSNQTNGREYFSINPRSSSDVIEGYVEIPNHQDVRVNGDPSSPRTMKPAPWIALNIEKILRPTLLEVVSVFFRYIRGTSHLGLWYPKGTRIETIVYADSDHAGDDVDHKSASGVCTFMGCCLTSWFAKKQTTLAISMTEAEQVSAGKACQQALWMKQALIDYGIRLDDVPIMTLENRYVHEGRTIDPSFYNDLSDDLVAKFTAIGFDCLLSLDEQICPRFIFEFYKTLKLERDSNNHFSIEFIINNHHFNLSLAQFAELTHFPNQGICIYFDAWGLDELEKTLEQIEPYNSRLPTLDDIRNLIHRRIVHEKIDKEGNTIHKLPIQIETNELFDHLRPCELVIME
ncbi:hypothetical protein Tco_0528053 [Tanacetum coccineum]